MIRVQLGDLVFPINPSRMTRTYKRALSAIGLLSSREALESQGLSLSGLSFSGILAGALAKSAMQSLEAKFEAGGLYPFLAPSIPQTDAVITSLEFEVEKGRFPHYEYIPYSVELLFASQLRTPSWSVQLQMADGALREAVGLLDFSVTDKMGGYPDEFSVTLDNREGQNNRRLFRKFPECKIQVGYEDSGVKAKLWGLVFDFAYQISKDGGSSVALSGRDFTTRLLEGYPLYQAYENRQADDIIKNATDGILAGTGIGTGKVQNNTKILKLNFRVEKRMTAVRKVCAEAGDATDPFWEAFVDEEKDLVFRKAQSEERVYSKVWGKDIVSLSVAEKLDPIRNKVTVYGKDGISATAQDAPSQGDYTVRTDNLEDNSLATVAECQRVADGKLELLKDPDYEVGLVVLGDVDLKPGFKVSFDDGDRTGLAGTYRVVQLSHKLSIGGGFVTELQLKKSVESEAEESLGQTLAGLAQDAVGGTSLVAQNPQFPVLGTITEVL